MIWFRRLPPLSGHSDKNCALDSCPLLSISEREASLTCFIFTCKIDGPYLVTFCCMLPYITRIHFVETFLLPQMFLRSQDQSQKVLELISNCYELSKFTIRRPHWSPPSMLTIFEHMVHSLLLKRHMMSFWCLFLNLHLTHPLLKYRSFIKKSNRIRPAYLKFTILSCRSWDTHVTRSSGGNVQN